MLPNYQTDLVPIVQSSLHRNETREASSMHNLDLSIFQVFLSYVIDLYF